MNKFRLKSFGFTGNRISNRSYIVEFQPLQPEAEKGRFAELGMISS